VDVYPAGNPPDEEPVPNTKTDVFPPRDPVAEKERSIIDEMHVSNDDAGDDLEETE
jgi:hypothetical protein